MKALFRLFRSSFLQPFLIVVAVALGVAVVTAVVAYIQSSNAQQRRLEADLSFREIRIYSGGPSLQGDLKPLPWRVGSVNLKPVVLTAADLEAVRAASPSVDYAYLHESHGGIRGDREYSFDAVTLDYLAAAKVLVIEGGSLTPSDFREQRPVMLITREEAARAYLTGDIIGKRVIDPSDASAYTIVGILPPSDPDDPWPITAIMPYKPPAEANEFQVRADEVSSLNFAVEDVSKLDTARAEVEAYARKTWGEGVAVSSQSLTEVRERTRAATLFTSIFASLGLLIAAFNILNLFLARVLRLQRSMAIRRALGASRRRVVLELALDATSLALLGSLLGILTATLLLPLMNGVLTDTSFSQGELSFRPLAALVALGASVGLSFLLSLFPAYQAVKTRPIDSLRSV